MALRGDITLSDVTTEIIEAETAEVAAPIATFYLVKLKHGVGIEIEVHGAFVSLNELFARLTRGKFIAFDTGFVNAEDVASASVIPASVIAEVAAVHGGAGVGVLDEAWRLRAAIIAAEERLIEALEDDEDGDDGEDEEPEPEYTPPPASKSKAAWKTKP
jgi:hypothetical protein